MKTQIKITGQISGNFELLNKLPYSSRGHKENGMFNSFLITYESRKEAQEALKELARSLKNDDMDRYVYRRNGRPYSVAYDASKAYIIDADVY